MTARVLIGERSSGATGIFVSPPGIDVLTAPSSQLTLNISDEVAQLLMLGRVSGTSASVVMGLSRPPMVFIRSVQTMSDVPGYPSGPLRPSPWINESNNSYATIVGNGASLSISCPIGNMFYQVYRKAII